MRKELENALETHEKLLKAIAADFLLWELEEPIKEFDEDESC